MFPPTIRRIHHQKGGRESRNVISSTVARLRSNKPQNLALGDDDLYPLSVLEGSRTQNEITGPNDIAVDIPPRGSIVVKQGWEVRSDEAV